MKTINLVITLLFAFILQTFGQTTNRPTFIKGSLDINYATRTRVDSSGKPTKGVVDIYRLDINISNSTRLYGDISHTPLILNTFGYVNQQSTLNYNLQCDVFNQNNPNAKPLNVGRIYGFVPIDQTGVYNFKEGSLRIGVLDIGSAKGFESKFNGIVFGKPIVKADGWLEKMKKEALNISKTVKGKTVTIAVKKYDKMDFHSHVLAKGPVAMYPESTVNGSMIYDYSRYVWYFKDILITYAVNGAQKADRLGGTIRWVESPNRKSNGEGEYQFDIRVNEPPPNETAVFAAADDESAFFETDLSIPCLMGTAKYKDTITANETVIASSVQIDLMGNSLTKQQVMNLFKLIFMTSIVPINAE